MSEETPTRIDDDLMAVLVTLLGGTGEMLRLFTSGDKGAVAVYKRGGQFFTAVIMKDDGVARTVIAEASAEVLAEVNSEN